MSLPAVIKLLEQANEKIEELTEERNNWRRLYEEIRKELSAAVVLCTDCNIKKAETPESKTFETCFSCLPDQDKTRLFEKAETEAHYWRDSYEQLFSKYQDELYRYDTRSSYDTCR